MTNGSLFNVRQSDSRIGLWILLIISCSLMAQMRMLGGGKTLQVRVGTLANKVNIMNDWSPGGATNNNSLIAFANTTMATLSNRDQEIPPQARTASSSAQQSLLQTCTFVIVCGKGETDAVQEMQALLTSILVLASCPLRFIFLTDLESADRIEKLFQHDLYMAKKPLTVDIIVVQMSSVEQFAKSISYNLSYHHSGLWGTSKLMIPWILQNEMTLDVDDNILIIDTDMIFIEDPATLFQYEFDNDKHIIHNASWVYKMPMEGANLGPSHICSCIVLVKWKKALEASVYPSLFQEALVSNPLWQNNVTHLYEAPHGDQGLYFGLMQIRPDLFASLASQWNADRCHNYLGGALDPGGKDSKSKVVSVIHNNCGVVPKRPIGHGVTYFEYYNSYQWHWLRGKEQQGGHVVKVNRSTSFYFPSG